MAVTGLDGVVYGVANMEKSRTYFSDWGLKKTSSGKTKAVFETEDGSEVVLRPRGSKVLPKAIQPGSTVRELIWGVSAKKDLAAIRKELSKDREVTEDKDGTLHSVDDMGLGIAFRRSQRRKLTVKPLPMNSAIDPGRVDQRATYYDRARPTHIGHCVFGVPDIKAMENFYRKRLGFHVSDYYRGRGVFLRSQARAGHHNLFFLETEDGKRSINHVAFGVRDIHEVFAGGMHHSSKGWKTAIGPGRHNISSAYFWYFDCPAGGATEYFTDEDQCTENWKPKQWDPDPSTFAEWVLGKGLPRSVALPPTREKRDAKAKS